MWLPLRISIFCCLFLGFFKSTSSTDCGGGNMCYHGGTCSQDSHGAFKCICAPPWTGTTCDTSSVPYFTLGRNMYVLNNRTQQSWTDAQSYCQTINNGNLATISSLYEQSYIQQFLTVFYPTWVWIGLRNTGSTISESAFQWIEPSQPVSYTNWYPGGFGSGIKRQPDGPAPGYVAMAPDWPIAYSWYDAPRDGDTPIPHALCKALYVK